MNKNLIKHFLIAGSVLAALALSQTAAADNRHHRRGYSDFGHNSHRYNSRNYYSSRYNPYHYGYRDRRSRSHVSLSYGSHHSRHRSHDVGNFLGGLVLGSLLSYPRHDPRHDSYVRRPVRSSTEVVYVRTPPSRNVVTGRRLLRDIQGNCFERQVDSQGNEIRIELDPRECAY